MNIKDFTHKVKLKQLSKKFNNHANRNSWKDTKQLEVKLTGFNRAIHAVGCDTNRESTLMELQTQIFDVRNILLRRSNARNSNYVTMYLRTDCSLRNIHGGMSSDTLYLVDIKTPKKTYSFDVNEYYNGDNVSWQLEEVVGMLVEDKSYQNVSKICLEIVKDWRYGGKETLQNMLTIGFNMSEFEYNVSLSFIPTGVKETSRGIKIGYQSNGTYQSLPHMIELTMKSEIKTVKLADIGVETSGYYSHDTRLHVRPEQVKAAKQFSKQVKSLTKE